MKDKTQKCCICEDTFEGHGNNPDPVKTEGRCCDTCNIITVIPARMRDIGKHMRWEPKND